MYFFSIGLVGWNWNPGHPIAGLNFGEQASKYTTGNAPYDGAKASSSKHPIRSVFRKPPASQPQSKSVLSVVSTDKQ